MFYDKLCGGKKVIAIELDPPADVDIEKYIKSLKSLKELDVDAVTIADCPVGRARIDSSLMAYKIKNEVGLEPVVHLTCRDRNLNATKALLLGLNIENIRNLIVVTGDPIPTAEKVE
ncbi:methylenetetrahydrofolate reductase [Peptostreptococcus sp. D1]|uniref:methylenetetrahydrofolate reductase n=1 Tax=Peptostreptococcus sp. D1 TaxID=72304 RepID=UPI001FA86920|nr:methylenetetrahydrofolate reductase [Peptostreptococcus sp. D1]